LLIVGAHNLETVTIATPFYNEEDGLDNFFKVLNKINNLLANKIKVKFLFIDDGSSDNTCKILNDFKDSNKNLDIKIYTHEKNYGYGRTLKNSIRLCDTKLLITYDSDCTYDFNIISKLVDKMNKGNYDIVNVSYKLAPKNLELNFLRDFLSWGSTFVNNFFFPEIKEKNISVLTCSFRIYKVKKIKDINIKSEDFNSCAELLIKSLQKNLIIKEIPGKNMGRIFGKSKMKIVKNIYNTLKTIYQIKISN